MDSAKARILDIIASYLGEPLSINQLTEKIKEKYGAAYYSNTYKKVKELQAEKLLIIENYGNTSLIKLNFDNFLLIDSLAEMELEKKISFFKSKDYLADVLEDLKDTISDKCYIKSISSINQTKNFQLNRFELLFLTLSTANTERDIVQLYKDTLRLQMKYNLRIDSLILTENDFCSLLRSSEINPLREAIAKETTILCPEAFWSKIKEASKDSVIKIIQSETRPGKISEQDLVGNLFRFGFKEFGSTISTSNKYCVEYIITELLLTDDARRLNSIPVLLSKNDFKENVLVFLSQKYRTAGKLLGLLTELQKITPNQRFERTITILQAFGEKEIPSNRNTILRNLELYDAIT